MKIDNLLALAATQIRSSSDILHAKLEHPNSRPLEVLSSNKCINITCKNKTPTVCISCQIVKGCKVPFELRNKVENKPFLKIHCYLWCLAPVEYSQHVQHYALLFDDHIR